MFRLSKFIKSFGSIKDLTNWDTEVLKQSKPILVDFHATWCGPCKRFAPVLEGLIKTNPNVDLVKVDIDQFEQIAAQNKVEVVPTLILFKQGKAVETFKGTPPKDELLKAIEKHSK